MATPESQSKHKRHWRSRRHKRRSAPWYGPPIVLAIAIILAGTLAWKGFQLVLRWSGHASAEEASQLTSNVAPRATDPWQRDALESIDAASAEAQGGNITAAEMAVDRVASIVEAARIEARKPPAQFFEMAAAGLDGVLRRQPENQRLIEHVTLVRIELAQLRSLMAGALGAAKGSAESESTNAATLGENGASSGRNGEKSLAPSNKGADDKHVAIGTPRSIAANHVFDPSVAGGDWIDASLTAETAEILLPPTSRLLVDNVRVRNLTIEGAAQTLDGIHWKNVTFVGTRVRYEGGEVDLHDVHFVRCTFGFTTDERGARLANAIALGESSIVIN